MRNKYESNGFQFTFNYEEIDQYNVCASIQINNLSKQNFFYS